jgi:lipid A disaccharide synthetase
VPEFIQDAARPETLAAAAGDWLDSAQRRDNYRRLAHQWSERLAQGAGRQAARAVLDHLEAARP